MAGNGGKASKGRQLAEAMTNSCQAQVMRSAVLQPGGSFPPPVARDAQIDEIGKGGGVVEGGGGVAPN